MARAHTWVTRLGLLDKERGCGGQKLHTFTKKFQIKAKLWMNHSFIFYGRSVTDIYTQQEKTKERKRLKSDFKNRLQLSQTEEKALQHWPQYNDHMWNSSVYLQCTESPISPQNNSIWRIISTFKILGFIERVYFMCSLVIWLVFFLFLGEGLSILVK